MREIPSRVHLLTHSFGSHSMERQFAKRGWLGPRNERKEENTPHPLHLLPIATLSSRRFTGMSSASLNARGNRILLCWPLFYFCNTLSKCSNSEIVFWLVLVAKRRSFARMKFSVAEVNCKLSRENELLISSWSFGDPDFFNRSSEEI